MDVAHLLQKIPHLVPQKRVLLHYTPLVSCIGTHAGDGLNRLPLAIRRSCTECQLLTLGQFQPHNLPKYQINLHSKPLLLWQHLVCHQGLETTSWAQSRHQALEVTSRLQLLWQDCLLPAFLKGAARCRLLLLPAVDAGAWPASLCFCFCLWFAPLPRSACYSLCSPDMHL